MNHHLCVRQRNINQERVLSDDHFLRYLLFVGDDSQQVHTGSKARQGEFMRLQATLECQVGFELCSSLQIE